MFYRLAFLNAWVLFVAKETAHSIPRYVSMFDAGSGQETDIGLIKYRDRYFGMPGFCALPRKTRAAYPRYVSTIDAGRAQKTPPAFGHPECLDVARWQGKHAQHTHGM
jgi:hypothetical protein